MYDANKSVYIYLEMPTKHIAIGCVLLKMSKSTEDEVFLYCCVLVGNVLQVLQTISHLRVSPFVIIRKITLRNILIYIYGRHICL